MPGLPDNLRAFDDVDATRKLIYGNTLDALKGRFPIEDDEFRLELDNPHYDGPQEFSLAQQKRALLTERQLRTPIKGTWRLFHKPTNTVLDQREDVIMHVPYLTQRGTFIHNGNEYSTISQQRLRPGAYVRRRRTGEVETQFNVLPGTGKGFHLRLEPETGLFKISVDQSNIPLVPLLHTLGVTDQDLIKAWGPELYEKNLRKQDAKAVPKLYERFSGYKFDSNANESMQKEFIRDSLSKFKMDPDVVARTLGVPDTDGITPQALLRATQKMLNVSKGAEEPDDRDSLMYSNIYSVEDLMQERIQKDAGKLARTLLYKARRDRSLKPVARGALDNYLYHPREGLLLGSGLAMPLEETNPLHVLEQANRLTKLGVGGIGSAEAVTDEARNVNNSQFGFVDGVAGPEGLNIGIDTRVSYRTYKGKDKKLYAEFAEPRSGKLVFMNPEQVAGHIVAFPGEMKKPGDMVTAMVNGNIKQVKKEDVQFEVPSLAHMMSPHANLNSMPTGFQPGRLFYASKYWSQYLPLVKGEVPLVDSLMPDGKQTFSEHYGRQVGSLTSKVGGTVVRVGKENITLMDDNGEVHNTEIIKDLPFNRLTSISYFPVVKAGDRVNVGDMLAHSNFTDSKTGAINMGINLRTAIIPARGQTYEDAYLISESAAKKLSTERLYGYDQENRNGVEVTKNKYISSFPSLFTKEQYDNIGDDGVVKAGTILQKGDPVILATGPKLLTSADAQLGKLHKVLRQSLTDKAVTWDNTFPGVVVDAVSTVGGARVNIKSTPPVQAGDKLTTGYSLKGVVGQIIKDDDMPRDPVTNEPYEMLLNPMGVLSRVAPNQLIEIALAKVAKKTGKQVRLPQLPPPEGWAAWAQQQLVDAGVSDSADLFDPISGKTIRNVGDGYAYVHAFHHLAEKKLSQRGEQGAYTIDEQPAKGSEGQAKRFGQPEINATLAHGATDVIKDVITIRGTKNEEYWKALRLGRPLPEPQIPFIYNKFMETLKAGGINVVDKGDSLSLMPMTDRDVVKLSKGEIGQSDMITSEFEPIPGGLFDMGKTGGMAGNRWTHVSLVEPLPNPVMEEPIRRVLGLTVNGMRDVLVGRADINGLSGGRGIQEALKKVDIDASIEDNKDKVRRLRGANRDNAVKVLGYLSAVKEQGIHPADWMISRVPVLPPMFRPVARMGDVALKTDMNELYRDLIEVNNSIKDLRKDMPETSLAQEKLNLYDAVTAVYGLGDPITPEGQSRRVKGAIRQIIGTNPKCYDDETELLTRTGWTKFGLVDGNIDVGTINPVTGKFEWQTPVDVLHRLYDGIMVHTMTQKLDLLVTPNHNHYVEFRIGKYATGSERGEAQWSKPEKFEAGQMIGTTRRTRFFTAALTPQTGSEPSPSRGTNAIDMYAFAAFVGLWLAEGWLSTDEHQVHICQSFNSRCVPYIDDVMTRLGIPYTRKLYSGRVLWWTITDVDLAAWMKINLGSGAGNKYISSEILNWDSSYLREVVAGYMRGDGEYRVCNENPKQNRTFYNRDTLVNYGNRASTISYKLVDSFAELCVRIGVGFRLTDTIKHDNPKWNVQYRFRIDGWNRVLVEYPKQHAWEWYTGSIHCVTVPNGLLVVRRSGRTAISGNSGMFQSRVLSKTVSGVGRGVVAPDPNLDMDSIGIPADSAWTLYKDFVMRRLVRKGYPALRAVELIDKRAPEAKEMLDAEMSSRPVLVNRAPTWHKFNILAFYPHISEGHVIRVSPLITKGFTMDFDGDQANFHVPISDGAMRQAKEKMLPSRNLFSLTDLRSIRHSPSMEMTSGLYQLTRDASKKAPVRFASIEEAKKAYREGRINVNDPIIVP